MDAQITLSTNKDKLDVDLIHHFLSNSYWAKGRSKERVQKSINHSICFGIYLNAQQIGFARVLTDHVAFAYIMDVFILEEHQGKGYGKQLMQFILNHPKIQAVKKWFLGTKDAQELYKRFGFEEAPKEISWMHLPGVEK